jgi:hypothetical protein
MSRKTKSTETAFLKQSLTLSDLERLDPDRNGEVDRADFLSYMLIALQKVEEEDIELLNGLFNRLDSNKDGVLNKDDIVAASDPFRRTMAEAVLDK